MTPRTELARYWKEIFLCLALGLALAGGALFVLRDAWIKKKIATLTAPPARLFGQTPPKGARPRLVMIGDSGISRWPAGSFGERWEVVNHGVGGETAAQLSQRFEADALDASPDMIVIAAGVNDLVAAAFLDAASARRVVRKTGDTLLDLARRARAPGRRVWLATLIPPSRPDLLRRPVWKESLRDAVAEVNARLRRDAPLEQVSLIDFAAALDSGDRRTPDDYRRDTLHLNARGYGRLTAALREAIDGPGR
jgi:lysophospholipase L1-like esterase